MENSSLVNRFLRYAAFGTQAAADVGVVPSSEGQRALGCFLAGELREIGLSDAVCDEHAYVIATLPSNLGREAPVMALIAHLDTAVEVSGENVRPRVLLYEGGDVVLDREKGIVIAEADFPELARFSGQEIIVTDGNTLLGADDKAGIAAIMEAVKWYADNPGAPHGTVKVVFTPDEEIGHGAALLDLEKLGADFAYTVDGMGMGTLSWETFNAAKATVTVTGRSVHPGSAKNKMKNALLMLGEFLAKLPEDERPETTEGREGFFHVFEIKGSVEHAEAVILVRDHDRERFEARKASLAKFADEVSGKYGAGSCVVRAEDQYYNMGDKLADKMHIVEYAREAMRRAGVTPKEIPVRGGTDGSCLTQRGLPTPDVFTGGMNAHGRQELLPVRSLEKSCETVINLIEIAAER